MAFCIGRLQKFSLFVILLFRSRCISFQRRIRSTGRNKYLMFQVNFPPSSTHFSSFLYPFSTYMPSPSHLLGQFFLLLQSFFLPFIRFFFLYTPSPFLFITLSSFPTSFLILAFSFLCTNFFYSCSFLSAHLSVPSNMAFQFLFCPSFSNFISLP